MNYQERTTGTGPDPAASFRRLWKAWHISGVRNPRTWGEDDGSEHRMMDGIEDLVRPSMHLRALSEKRLRASQLRQGWTNSQLLEHLRGEYDNPDSEDGDEAIYRQLQNLGCEDCAHWFIPEASLARLRHSDSPPAG